ncbi:MAG: membrane protein insertase YidC [Thermodesulfobacteriota bacterium]|nr:membrane protein insertase YidC [Thermodesulfobacteriota bacterium]
MEKRTLLAIVVSIMILLAWDFFVIKPSAPQPKKKELITQTQIKEGIEKTITPRIETKAASTEQGDKITIETPLYVAVWDTKGGSLVSLKLRQYKETMKADSDLVEMLSTPMPVMTMKGGFTDRDLMFSSGSPMDIQTDHEIREIEFSTEISDGIVLKKVYQVDPASYVIGFRTVLVNNTGTDLSLNMDICLDETYPDGKKSSRYTFEGPVLLNGKHLEEFKISKIEDPGESREFSGDLRWAGVENKYFLRVLISPDAPESTFVITRKDKETIGMRYSLPPLDIKKGTSLSSKYLMYVGPKELNTLKDAGYQLKGALDFGFFDFIAKPMLLAMNWIQGHTNSYGLAIIILTFIIKLVLYPLSLKSFTSMKEMQKVQPLMKEIQAQYKDDKQKLNQEMMKLYKEHKINPMGGCLPMLLQIPILFALYRVFLYAIELRHTPFHIFGTWLPDLSAKDPYFITPILMGLSQFLMQKMTPATGDATQQKMMMFMPVVFTFIFLSFPSGLVLYWLISNILSIAQQAYINRDRT